MTITLCDSGAVKLKAGTDVSTSLTDSDYTKLINQAESYINAAARINFVDLFSGLNDDVKFILEDAASSHAAMSAIGYNMNNYPSTARAQTLLNINWARLQENINLLKEKPKTDFMKEA